MTRADRAVQLWIDKSIPYVLTTHTLDDGITIVTRTISEVQNVPGILYLFRPEPVENWLRDVNLRKDSPVIGFSALIAEELCGWTKFHHEC